MTLDPHDYRQRAQLHRPRYRDEMRAAVAELRARGLTAYDIAQAMGLSVRAVTDLLGTHKAGAT